MDGDGWREREERVMNRLRDLLRDVPSIDAKFARPSLFTSKTPIEVEVSGYNLTTLQSLSNEVVDRMEGIPGLVDVKTSSAEIATRYQG